MIFTSIDFAIFFVLVIIVYWMFSKYSFRKWFLLFASLCFYGYWDVRFLFLMGIVILTAYFGAILLTHYVKWNKVILSIGIAIQLGVLCIFKYFDFFISSMRDVLHLFGSSTDWDVLNLILPVGISFYTFQGISYLVDVYRNNLKTEKNFIHVSLYIAFFPQLVAGPIVRASEFIPQLHTRIKLTSRDFAVGLQFLLIGMLYKGVFADTIARFVDPVFADINKFNNYSIWLAALGFHSQIYFDFAGYSSMAIGIARMLGYKLNTNFNFPYLATSPTTFWRRWHISLSTWLRDYVYIPLGGNRKGFFKQQVYLFETMLLGGLWHGASWNFVAWGSLHGLALVVHKIVMKLKWGVGSAWIKSSKINLYTWLGLGWLSTQFVGLICWLVFRLPETNQLLDALYALGGIRDDGGLVQAKMPLSTLLPVWIDAFFIGTGFLFRFSLQKENYWQFVAMGLLFAVILSLLPLQTSDFIYFQF